MCVFVYVFTHTYLLLVLVPDFLNNLVSYLAVWFFKSEALAS